MDSWQQKLSNALHYCIEGRFLFLTAESLNPVAHKQITSTITNLSQANMSLALDLSLPLSVHDYISKSSANIKNVKQYNEEVELVEEFLFDYEEITGKRHKLDELLDVLQSTSKSLTFSDKGFDPARLTVPNSTVSRSNMSNFVCSQASLKSGWMLRNLGYTPDISFASTVRAKYSPEYFSPRKGVGQKI